MVPSQVPSGSPSLSSVPSAPPSQMCVPVTINFDTAGNGSPLSPGQYVQDEWLSAYGMSIIAEGAGGSGFTPDQQARLFDSSNPVNDTDLGSPNNGCSGGGPGVSDGNAEVQSSAVQTNCDNQNLILIIQMSNTTTPNDNRDGGMITFVFDPPLYQFTSMDVMDLETNGNQVLVHEQGALSPNAFQIRGRGDNTIVTAKSTAKFVTNVTLDLVSSGAITELNFIYCPDGNPEPTSRSSVIESPLAKSGTPSSDDCEVTENHFLDAPQCSQGNFNPENVKVSSSTDDTVTFSVKQPFTAEKFAVWFDDPTDDGDYCFYSTDFEPADEQEFTAKCENGHATVSIYAGGLSTEFNQVGVESHVPQQQCKDEYDFPEFNPSTRCYWELQVPCDCSDDSRRRLSKEQPSEKEAPTENIFTRFMRGSLFSRK